MTEMEYIVEYIITHWYIAIPVLVVNIVAFVMIGYVCVALFNDYRYTRRLNKIVKSHLEKTDAARAKLQTTDETDHPDH